MRSSLPHAAFQAGWGAALALGLGLVASVAAEPVLTDQTINDKIEDVLLRDPAVGLTRIDVVTTHGVVSLTGSVDNLLAKERAARLAETVKGVRAIVNRLEVNPPGQISDARILSDVQAAILADPATNAFELRVSVADGVVTLGGVVDSYAERQLAQNVVKGVRGVRGLEDEIKVEFQATRPDREIERDIEQTLRWNAYVDDARIDVDVVDGRVTLAGTVGSLAEKTQAQADAWVAGVRSVSAADLEVAGWARDDRLRGNKYAAKSETEIRDAVHDALLYDPRVQSFNVVVDVVGSTVTLRGTVDNLKAKRAAEQDARRTVGVSSVFNRLKIRRDVWPDDSEIAADIRDALLRDPYVHRSDVTVTVVNGAAYLYGFVDSYFERNRADDIASRVAGVVAVKNHLKVDYEQGFVRDPYVEDAYVAEEDLIGFERRSPYRTDDQIKEAIESELWWSPYVNSDQVHVAVERGVATLTGTVDTWSERRAATDNAYEGGATLVDNDLIIDLD